jgi:hypothetical protein
MIESPVGNWTPAAVQSLRLEKTHQRSGLASSGEVNKGFAGSILLSVSSQTAIAN